MLDTSLRAIERVISRDEKEANNVAELLMLLNNCGVGISRLRRYNYNNATFYVNLAGLVCMQPVFKREFFNAVLQVRPQLLMQEETVDMNVLGYPPPSDKDECTSQQYLKTPIGIAIEKKDPDMLAAILHNPAFSSYKDSNFDDSFGQIIRSYMEALLVYNGKSERFEEIMLKRLLMECKNNMSEARTLGKTRLQQVVMNMYYYKDDVLDAQRLGAIEICKKFFATKAEGEEWLKSINEHEHGRS